MATSSPHSTAPKELRLVVLVSGRGTNLQALLDAAQSGRIKSRIVSVISNIADAAALTRAAAAGLGVATRIIPSKGRSATDFFAELKTVIKNDSPDLIVLAGFMRILPEDIINEFAGRIINIHPSLLPEFPGRNAQQQALDAGVKETGCTVHFVDKGCDTGPVILQKMEPVLRGDTAESLSTRLLKREHAALVEAIILIETGKVVLQGR